MVIHVFDRIENIVGKEGISIYAIPTMFQMPHLSLDKMKIFENAVGKEEITLKEQFLLFPQCFLLFWRTLCHLHQIENCHLQTLSVWKSINLVFGIG